MTKRPTIQNLPFSTAATSVHSDLFYTDAHRAKGWRKGGRTYPYGLENLTVAEIGARAQIGETTVRKYLNQWEWPVKKLFLKYGDTNATPTDPKP